MWTKTIDGRPPRSERMTGLDQEQAAWLYEELDSMIVWDSPAGRPRALPLYTAMVVVLFSLRQNLASDVIGELFGCSGDTVDRYSEELEPLIDTCLTVLYEEICAQARRDPVLVDGLVVPIGERDGVDDLFSGKKHISGQNVQVVATLDGRVADVGDPCPGSVHDSRAFTESGIAGRWKDHIEADIPQMIGDKGYGQN
jgi:hypothetical protein